MNAPRRHTRPEKLFPNTTSMGTSMPKKKTYPTEPLWGEEGQPIGKSKMGGNIKRPSKMGTGY